MNAESAEPRIALPTHEMQRIVARYSERFQAFGHDLRTLNPGNFEKYRLQHTIHASIGDLRGRDVLDIGCGLGHFYEFLKTNSIDVNYTGYDIVPEFIDSNRGRFPEARFELRDIFRDGIDGEHDYVVMCQVFNNRYADIRNDVIVKQAMAIAFQSVRRAVSIDMLSSYVNYEEPHLFYFSPEEMFAHARSLTRFVCLRHDYLPFHFTIVLYRDGALA